MEMDVEAIKEFLQSKAILAAHWIAMDGTCDFDHIKMILEEEQWPYSFTQQFAGKIIGEHFCQTGSHYVDHDAFLATAFLGVYIIETIGLGEDLFPFLQDMFLFQGNADLHVSMQVELDATNADRNRQLYIQAAGELLAFLNLKNETTYVANEPIQETTC